MNDAKTAADATLYERIGGAEAVRKLVDRFYERIVDDPELAPYFKHVPMDKLRHMQFEFFAAALDGPVHYTGRPILHAHQGHRITLAAYQRFVHHLFETLEERHLSEQERYEIISRLNAYTDDIVSAGTGMVG